MNLWMAPDVVDVFCLDLPGQQYALFPLDPCEHKVRIWLTYVWKSRTRSLNAVASVEILKLISSPDNYIICRQRKGTTFNG
jgi:hypothetical protein